ncbi:hypothetical protein SAMN05444003_0116 [Cognatiyoonia sediminum]|uniref:Uncharacterized protein n=1 Tax=Cognatiyoonia sediminum TaxID=1508389 RepID=A0A1M5L5T4_9RHOB|nr:hypothetical protein SAMN05444003_0116 [Cognatiyoonia sediminum]
MGNSQTEVGYSSLFSSFDKFLMRYFNGDVTATAGRSVRSALLTS